MTNWSPQLGAVLLLGFASAVACAEPPTRGVNNPLPRVMHVESGGVGIGDRESLGRTGPYNLKIVTATRTGEYIADVDVTIADARGVDLVTTQMKGPWLIAQLAPGRYRLTAQYRGTTQVRDVVVADDLKQEILMRWPDDGPQSSALR
jgi:hypothetical protein